MKLKFKKSNFFTYSVHVIDWSHDSHVTSHHSLLLVVDVYLIVDDIRPGYEWAGTKGCGRGRVPLYEETGGREMGHTEIQRRRGH